MTNSTKLEPPLLLFDLDGTLTNPEVGIVSCLEHALQSVGVTPPPSEELRSFIGPPLGDTLATLIAEETPGLRSQALASYRARFSEIGLFENSVFPGIQEALEELRDAGHPLSVATSKPTVFADRIIDHFSLREFFPTVFGTQLGESRSSKVDLLEEILELKKPRQAVMIGDRRFDIEAAKAVRIASVGVLWGFGSREELEEAGADVVVEGVGELVAAIRSGLVNRMARVAKDG